ncbi:MAG: isochorismatase family protein [Oligoflexales bacterium]
MNFVELKYENALLCIIDIQDNLLKTMKKKVFNEKLRQLELLVKMFTLWERPIIATEQYPKGLGSTHTTIKSWFKNFEAIAKTSFSCLGSTDFQKKLNVLEKGWIILTGMETHICVC